MMSEGLSWIASTALRWLWSQAADCLASLGWAGMAVLFTGGVLAVTLGMNTFRLLRSPKGIAFTSVVLLAGIWSLRWTQATSLPTARSPIATRPATPKGALPRMAAAIKGEPSPPPPVVEARVEKPKPEPRVRLEDAPLDFYALPVVAPVPQIPPPPPVPPLHHSPVVVAAKPLPGKHHPVHHAAKAAVHPTHSGVAARPAGPMAANHAGGGPMPGHLPAGGHAMPTPHPMSLRQSNAQAFVQMESMMNAHMQHLLGDNPHQLGGMAPHMGGAGHPGMGHPHGMAHANPMGQHGMMGHPGVMPHQLGHR